MRVCLCAQHARMIHALVEMARRAQESARSPGGRTQVDEDYLRRLVARPGSRVVESQRLSIKDRPRRRESPDGRADGRADGVKEDRPRRRERPEREG